MAGITRRQFFEESMIATAAAAASTSATSSPAQEPARRSANETLRHAVIGCRIRGKVHAREFSRQPGVMIAYVCDPDSKLAGELAAAVEAEQGHRPQAVQDLRQIMDDRSIDTVSIAAPNHWHALAAIWAMQSGKDVYVEKPVSHNVVEGRRMIQAAEATGQLCQTGTQRRSSQPLAAAADFIKQGKLGTVSFARSIIYGRRDSIGPRGLYEVPAHIDYNLWLGPAAMTALTRPQLHYDWHWDWNTGSGELGNNNIHIVDVCRWLMGLEGLGDSVLSVGGRLGYQDAGETPNTQIVAHHFGDKTIVQEVRGLESDPFSNKFRAGWIIHGTEGYIAESSLFDLEGKLVQTFTGTEGNHFVNFIGAVRSGDRSQLNADISQGHESSALCHVGNISHRTGRPVPAAEIAKFLEGQPLDEDLPRSFARMLEHLQINGVDLGKTPLMLGEFLRIKGESFVGHANANALLARSYRKPFELPDADQFKEAAS